MVALNVKSRPVPSLLWYSLKCRCTSHLYSGVVDLAMSTRTKLLLQTFIYGNIDTNIVIDLRQKRGKECPNWQNSMRKTEKSKFGDIWTTLAICTYIHTFFSQCLPIVNMHLVRTVGVDIAIHIHIGCTCSTFLHHRVKSGLASSLLSSTLSSMGLFHTVVVDLATSLWWNTI